ncbi:MAG: hypothetical protein GXO21_05890 [Aquificae bacterium]|nr:hypothetical protein [Aquificota bacterium]
MTKLTREKIIKLQQEAREALLKEGNKYKKEVDNLLKQLEKDIIHRLAKEPKSKYQEWRLREILKDIENYHRQFDHSLRNSVKKMIKNVLIIAIEKALTLLNLFGIGKELKRKYKEKIIIKEDSIKVADFSTIPVEAIEFLAAYSMQFTDNLSQDLIKQIKMRIQLGIAEGKTLGEIASEISVLDLPTIKPFKSVQDRAYTIARTETARAYHMGQLLKYKEWGVEEIIIICGKIPCPICQSHCDTVHPIEYADEVLKHPNCTCTYAPIKRKGKVLNTGGYYEEKKNLSEKKQWTLNTAKSFYKEVENRFKNVKTKEEAVEVFKEMFPSEREFYKHLKKHIFENIYDIELENWVKAREEDVKSKYKYSKEYLEIFIKTIVKPSKIIYQLPNRKEASPRTVIYSKLNTFAIILEGNKIISVSYNEFDTLEEWIKNRKEKDKEIIEVGLDEEFRTLYKSLQERFERFTL